MRFYRVRIRTEAGWTDWSPTLRVEAGLLRADDWTAQAVTLPDDPGASGRRPRRSCAASSSCPGRSSGRGCTSTSLGLHDVRHQRRARERRHCWLRAGRAYRHRLLAETYDVTDLLRPGANVIAATLGRRLVPRPPGLGPWRRTAATTGSELALIAQLEVELADGSRHVMVTDGPWHASTGGGPRLPTSTTAATIDLRERHDRLGSAAASRRDGWLPVRGRAVRPVRHRAAHGAAGAGRRGAPPDARQRGRRRPSSLDGGQNIAGFVRLRVRGARGEPVDRAPRRGAGARRLAAHPCRCARPRPPTRYVLADDGEIVLEPTLHASTASATPRSRRTREVLEADVRGHQQRHAAARATFACSDPRCSSGFHENVVWSQRDNFVSVPTDCPQRDERLGWTGDAQAFAPTGVHAVRRRGVLDVLAARPGARPGRRAGCARGRPGRRLDGEARFGRAGWADAATIVPWAVYESYGDATVLRRPARRASGVGSASLRGPPGGATGCWARHAVRRLAGPGRACGPALGGQDRLRLPGQRLPRAQRAPGRGRSPRTAAATTRGRRDTRGARRTAVAAARPGRAGATHAITTQTGCAVALRFGLVPGGGAAGRGGRAGAARARGGRPRGHRASWARRSCCPRCPTPAASTRPT